MSTPTPALSASRLPSTWRDRVILLIALATGTALTLLASASLQQAEALRLQVRKTRATQAVISVVKLELARTTEAVRTAGLMLESNPQLNHGQFDQYMQKMVAKQLSVNLMEWQPIVPASELAQFEAAARAGGQPNYRVLQPDASGTGWEAVHGRDEYVPVLYAWPPNYRTEGLDMSFSPQRMASKLQSRATGQPAASGTFEFMKEGKVKSGATAMAISTTVFGPEQSAKGYLAAVVDLSTLFQQATELADASKFDLLVFDTATPAASPIFFWKGADSDLTSVGSTVGPVTATDPSANLNFAQQAWKLVLHPRPAFYAEGQEQGARLVLAAGMAMTVLMVLLLFQQQASRRKIERAESVTNQARQTLAAQSRNLEEAQRIAHVGSWHLDASGTQVWSDEMYRMLGLNPKAPPPLYAQAINLFTPESWERLSSALTHTMASGTPYELELEMIKADGSHGWMQARGEALRDASGAIVGARGTVADVSERVLAAEALRTSEQNLATTLHSIGDAVIATDADGCVTRMNPTAERLTGWPLEDALGHPLTDVFRIVNASTRETVTNPVQLVKAKGQVVGLANHTILLAKDGREYQIADSAAPIRNAAGTLVGVVLVFSDVTEKYHAELALKQSELRYRSLLENLACGVVVHHTDTTILYSNSMADALLGLSHEQVLGKTAPDPAWCFLQDDGTPMPLDEYPINRVLASGEHLKNHVVGVRHPDRVAPTWLLCNAYPTCDDAGAILQVVVTFNDITPLKEAEQALIDSEERWKFAIEGAGDGLWDWNIQTGVAFYSPRYKAMYGYVDADFGTASDEWSSRIHPDDAPSVFATLQPFMEGKPGPASVEFRMLCKDGSWKWTLGRGMVVKRDADGKPVRMIGTNTDISERKQNEQILQQSLKDKQALLMEVHHRVKNNLQVISSLLRLEARRSALAETRNVLTDMQGRIRSMAVLHESLYRAGTFASVDLASYLRQLANQAFRAHSGIDGLVRLVLELSPVSVSMDQAIPCGLLVNELISNCLKHAFPQQRSGQVKVELHALDPQNPNADALWHLCVSDNGVGLASDFETKRTNSLGMQLVEDLSRQIGGNLTISSQLDAGAEFTVHFQPQAPAALSVPA